MTVWYNAASDKFPLAKLGGLVDATDTNSTVEFSESVFKRLPDGTIDCFLYATSVTDVKKMGDNAWKWEPIPIYFQLHPKAYEKWGANKTKTPVEPSDFTKWLHSVIDALIGTESHVLLKGKIVFTEPANSMTAAMLISGLKADGSAIPDAARDFLASQLCDLQPIEALQHLKLETLPDTASKSYGGSGYSRGETQAERLAATKAFLIAEFSPAVGVTDAKTLSELAVALSILQSTDQQLYHAVQVILQAL